MILEKKQVSDKNLVSKARKKAHEKGMRVGAAWSDRQKEN